MELANCHGVDPAIFFPKKTESHDQAMAFCRSCVVRDECLAKHINERAGIWGGTTGRQRQRIRTERDRNKRIQGRNNKALGGGNAER